MVAKKPWGMLFPEVFAFVSKDIVTRCHNIFVLSLRESTAAMLAVATLAKNKAGV